MYIHLCCLCCWFFLQCPSNEIQNTGCNETEGKSGEILFPKTTVIKHIVPCVWPQLTMASSDTCSEIKVTAWKKQSRITRCSSGKPCPHHVSHEKAHYPSQCQGLRGGALKLWLHDILVVLYCRVFSTWFLVKSILTLWSPYRCICCICTYSYITYYLCFCVFTMYIHVLTIWPNLYWIFFFFDLSCPATAHPEKHPPAPSQSPPLQLLKKNKKLL